MKKTYTLPELVQRVSTDYFTAQDICGVLGCNAETIRLTAKQRPDLLGFPVIIIGTRVKIPRIPFLRYMGVCI